MGRERDPLEQLTELLESRGVGREVLSNLLVLISPVDLAEHLEDLDTEAQLRVLYVLDPPRAAQVLTAMSSETQRQLVEKVGDEKLSEVINALPSHEGADLVHLLSKDKERAVLDHLEPGKRRRVERLLQYAPDTAGGLMTTNYVAVPQEFTAAQAIRAIQGAVRAETVDYIYAVDDAQTLKGVCSLRELLQADPDAPVQQLMKRDVIATRPETDQEAVANLARRSQLRAVPVTTEEGVLVGVVTLRNVLDVVHQEAEEDILRLAGVTGSSYQALHSVGARIRARLPWLAVTLVGELLLAYFMRRFNATIEQYTFLAFFFPVNNAVAGNHGLQSSALVTRGVATGEIRASRFARLLWDEAVIGFAVGLMSGVASGAFAWLIVWKLSTIGHVALATGIIVAFSMTLGLTIAALSGIVTPLAFYKAGKDPALAAGPFISALNDIICTMIYLATASLVLSH